MSKVMVLAKIKDSKEVRGRKKDSFEIAHFRVLAEIWFEEEARE
jgi:hypothetical protein